MKTIKNTIIVKPLLGENKSGIIQIKGSEVSTYGEVRACHESSCLKNGDMVCWQEKCGYVIDYGGEKLVVINEDFVLAKIGVELNVQSEVQNETKGNG